jgi:hypothetical protein
MLQRSLNWKLWVAVSALTNFLTAGTALAATRSVPCNGDITSAMNTAISASVNGDTVNIGAGSCTMGRLNMITNKNITIMGAGIDSTLITANSGFGQIETTGSNQPTWRLSGFTLRSGSAPGAIIVVWANQSASWRGPFRIDRVRLDYPSNGPDGSIAVYGPVYGLIDRSEFIQQQGAAILTGMELSSETGSSASNLKGAYAASQAYQPGSPSYLYIEGSTFRGTGPNGIAAIDTGYTGGRFVVRYNRFENATLYAHWTTGGSINSLWWEVYNNKFNWTLGGSMYPMRLQGGGSGLIYNNTITGFPSHYILLGEGRLPDQGQTGAPLSYCDGSRSWDGNASDSAAPGWPCLSQTGRDAGRTLAQIMAGDKQPSFPLYLWNNGRLDSCSAAGSTSCDNSFTVSTYSPSARNYFKSTPHSTPGFGNGDVDFFVGASKPAGAGSHTLRYTPYAYPHPLASGTTSVPPPPPAALAAPTNLRVQ